jgi:hypothetical protein
MPGQARLTVAARSELSWEHMLLPRRGRIRPSEGTNPTINLHRRLEGDPHEAEREHNDL